jgi:transcriptional regulator with XRE-family HTH domain
MTKSLLEEYAEDPTHRRLLLQESAIYEVTELLESVMHELGVTRSELATRLGKSRGWVTQLLDGEANKTIRTVADAFAVLGREYRSFQTPIQIENKPTFLPNTQTAIASAANVSRSAPEEPGGSSGEPRIAIFLADEVGEAS